MKVLLDVNVILDLWRIEEQNIFSYEAVDIISFKNDDMYITATELPTLAYVLEKHIATSKDEVIEIIKAITNLCQVLDTNVLDAQKSIENYSGDFEDDLIMQCAYRHNMDCILTNNIKDFSESLVPAITPKEFVRMYKPTCLDYDMIDF